jgi:hypothetical protein
MFSRPYIPCNWQEDFHHKGHIWHHSILIFCDIDLLSGHLHIWRMAHGVVRKISEALENKKYCSAAFLDISQASNKVWHTGLLYKLRRPLLLNYFLILKSYLHNRHFLVKVVPSQCRPTSSQCPRVIIIPAIYCRPDNLTKIYHSKLCRWYCSTRTVLATGSQKLQTNLLAFQNWIRKWRIKANGCKSIHVTFTTRKETCHPVHINNVQLPEKEVKYLGLHLDRILTWHKNIFIKRKQLWITLTKMCWLLGRKLKLSTNNKLILYKAIL